VLSTIHQDDLAEIYVGAVERGHLAAGLIIDATVRIIRGGEVV
jgi:hypothetical protein